MLRGLHLCNDSRSRAVNLSESRKQQTAVRVDELKRQCSDSLFAKAYVLISVSRHAATGPIHLSLNIRSSTGTVLYAINYQLL